VSVSALFVEAGGIYPQLGVDSWDAERDGRLYTGPNPVVAHPPCKRWGRYWHGGPSARVRRLRGDDGGCFAAALHAVRLWGGVLEHPAASSAWEWHRMIPPEPGGGWTPADAHGWTCHVEQGHYGHPARKATWLYAVRTERPELIWGPSQSGVRLDHGYHSAEERARAKAEGWHRTGKRTTAAQNLATPPAFAQVLLAMARSVEAVPLDLTTLRKRASDTGAYDLDPWCGCGDDYCDDPGCYGRDDDDDDDRPSGHSIGGT